MVWLEGLPNEWWNKYRSFGLSSECLQELNIELLFLVRNLLLQTRTYARVCKRTRIRANDLRNALDARYIHGLEDRIDHRGPSKPKTISISSLLDQPLTDLDQIQLTMHWLAIDGEQPIIPENPLPNFTVKNPDDQEQQKKLPAQLSEQSPLLKKLFEMAIKTKLRNHRLQDHVHPLTKNNLTLKPYHSVNISVRRPHTINSIHIPLQSSPTCLAHELSIEQQLYFKSLTESCFDERHEQCSNAFHSLSTDAALQPLLPRLFLFVVRGIQTNIHRYDPHFVIRFLSILNTLIVNPFLCFDKYLHLIIPALSTCLICLFDMPKNSNHNPMARIDQAHSKGYSTIWLLREQASDLLSSFNQKYSHILHLTDRIASVIKSNMLISGTVTTFSIVYASLRTLLLIDTIIYKAFVIDALRNYKKTKIIEPDFDLEPMEQQSLFDQRVDALLQHHGLHLADV